MFFTLESKKVELDRINMKTHGRSSLRIVRGIQLDPLRLEIHQVDSGSCDSLVYSMLLPSARYMLLPIVFMYSTKNPIHIQDKEEETKTFRMYFHTSAGFETRNG